MRASESRTTNARLSSEEPCVIITTFTDFFATAPNTLEAAPTVPRIPVTLHVRGADEISQWQNYNVTAAPLLEETPETALGKVYLFKNGKSGEGLYGYQQEIFSGTPEQQMYGSLRLAVVAEWNQGHKKSVIESEKDLLEQVKNGRIVLDESETILNIPQIKWPGGQMPQIENLTMADL